MPAGGLSCLLDVFGLVPNAASQTSTALYGPSACYVVDSRSVALLMLLWCSAIRSKRKKVSSAASVAALIVFAICCSSGGTGRGCHKKFANFGRYAGANAELAAQPCRGRVVLMGNSDNRFLPKRASHLFEAIRKSLVRHKPARQAAIPAAFPLRCGRPASRNCRDKLRDKRYRTEFGSLRRGCHFRQCPLYGRHRACKRHSAWCWRPAFLPRVSAGVLKWLMPMDKIRSLNARVKAYADARY